MKIVALNQFFWPDQAATSQLLTDLARQLAAEGHDVTVICGAPGYAGADSTDRPSVRILQAPSLPFSRGALGRVMSYGSYLASAMWRALWIGRADVVLTMTTPPLVSLAGNLIKQLHGATHVVWEMDVYPEIATDVGVMRRGSLVERAIRSLAHRSRHAADRVWVLGECMRRRIVATGCDPARIDVCENWSNASLYEAPVDAASGRLRVLYSGNLGRSHDVDTLHAAMVALRDDSRIVVQIAGGGSERVSLETRVRAEQLPNVTFLPYASYQSLGRVLSSADVGLVTLRDACEGAVVPSKIYGLMACGRPLLFVGPAESTPALTIRRFACGWRVACGDVAGLVDVLTMLAARPDLVRDAGANARAAFLAHYDREPSVARLSRAIGRLRPAAPPHAEAVGEDPARPD